MSKVFGIVLLVLAVWVGLEVYTKGTQDACYGVFSWFDDHGGAADASAASGEPRSLVKRIGEKVRGDLQTGAARSTGTPEADLDAGDTMNGDVDDVEE